MEGLFQKLADLCAMVVQARTPVNARNPLLLNVAYRREQLQPWALAYISRSSELFIVPKPCVNGAANPPLCSNPGPADFQKPFGDHPCKFFTLAKKAP
jgi:hypothetical protein